MNPERWQQVDQLFHSALERSGGERAAFLAQACIEDERLRQEVESLLSFHDLATSFIEKPAGDAAAELLLERHARLTPGTMVNRYKILDLLGKGGMGVVYLAEDTELHRRIALKVLPAGFTRDSDRVRRFVQEAHAASALNHPNIVTIHEIGRLDDVHFIVTEFIEGQTLREQFRAGMRLAEALEVAIQVAAALDAAHAAGIVHRDIKPENIMLRSDGYVKVLDFGLAKLVENQMSSQNLETGKEPVGTNPGMVMGTVNYMSPEQARGLDVDARTDLWSLGVVLYEMVTGRVPFGGETTSHVVVSILENDPAPLALRSDLPPELEQIITQALRKDKTERYRTASDLGIVLRSLKQDLEADARLQSPFRPDRRGRVAATQSDGPAAAETFHRSTANTADATVGQSTSSAEYLVGEIKHHKRGAGLAATAMVLVLATLAYLFLLKGEDFTKGGEAIDSVAVMPFVNVNADHSIEYLSEGITDSIINSLSPLSNLRVMSLSSVLRYKGQQVDPQVVGRELNVRAVLIGRLTQQGEALSISTELVDVRDNSRLWGQQYDRKLADILSLQGEISERISEKLRRRLSGQEKQQIAKRYTENTEAYLLYQQGREHFRRRTRAAIEESIKYLEEAIRKDLAYALARVQLAYAYGDPSSPLPFKERRQKIESLLLKALELDNDLAEAHALLGGIRQDEGDWLAAEREFKRALDLDPNSFMAHGFYASYLQWMERHDEAIAEWKRAQELEPLAVRAHADVGYALYFARRYDEAIEQFKKTIDMDPKFAPAHARLGATYVQKKMYEEAILELEKARVLDNSPERPGRFAWPAYAYAVSGQRNKAQRMLAELKELAKQHSIPPINFAIIYTGLAEKDQAFAWLEKVYQEGNGRQLGEVRVNPMFDSLRSDPRFASLLRRVNLTP
ncbi:MAG: protein kinase [Pyrinomonadaceae bacterium]|nr:protein kinase [Pyrinomonadaceae bacterium]